MKAQDINLYRPELDVQREIPVLTWVIVSMLAGASLVGGMAWLADKEARLLKAELARIEQERSRLELRHVDLGTAARDSAATYNDRLAKLEATRERLDNQRRQLQGVMAGVAGQGFAEPLRLLAEHRAEGVWLTEIELGPGQLDWRLAGRALHPEGLPGYIDRLEAGVPFARFDDRVVEIERDEPQDGVAFRIQAPGGASRGRGGTQ